LESHLPDEAGLLFNVALCARRRAGFLAGILFFSMAFGAHFVHDVFVFQFTFCFEFCDGSCFLGKYGMTYLTVTELSLVLAMGKRDIASLAAVYFNIFCALILAGHGPGGH
jgi:hypothetical protein